MRKAYKEWGDLPTLWIVDEGLWIAIECDTNFDYTQKPWMNDRCITHDMSSAPSYLSNIVEASTRCSIPLRFRDVMHEYDWLCEV
jgi:hypothetical protein